MNNKMTATSDLFALLVAIVLLPLSACKRQGTFEKQSPSQTAAKSAKSPVIRAEPNPVPPGTEPGSTVISWDTGDGNVGEVYVSISGAPEQLFSRYASASRPANWISSGQAYEFVLYRGTNHSERLASVKVTRR
jgi:hypothetical protein